MKMPDLVKNQQISCGQIEPIFCEEFNRFSVGVVMAMAVAMAMAMAMARAMAMAMAMALSLIHI